MCDCDHKASDIAVKVTCSMKLAKTRSLILLLLQQFVQFWNGQAVESEVVVLVVELGRKSKASMARAWSLRETMGFLVLSKGSIVSLNSWMLQLAVL